MSAKRSPTSLKLSLQQVAAALSVAGVSRGPWSVLPEFASDDDPLQVLQGSGLLDAKGEVLSSGAQLALSIAADPLRAVWVASGESGRQRWTETFVTAKDEAGPYISVAVGDAGVELTRFATATGAAEAIGVSIGVDDVSPSQTQSAITLSGVGFYALLAAADALQTSALESRLARVQQPPLVLSAGVLETQLQLGDSGSDNRWAVTAGKAASPLGPSAAMGQMVEGLIQLAGVGLAAPGPGGYSLTLLGLELIQAFSELRVTVGLGQSQAGVDQAAATELALFGCGPSVWMAEWAKEAEADFTVELHSVVADQVHEAIARMLREPLPPAVTTDVLVEQAAPPSQVSTAAEPPAMSPALAIPETTIPEPSATPAEPEVEVAGLGSLEQPTPAIEASELVMPGSEVQPPQELATAMDLKPVPVSPIAGPPIPPPIQPSFGPPPPDAWAGARPPQLPVNGSEATTMIGAAGQAPLPPPSAGPVVISPRGAPPAASPVAGPQVLMPGHGPVSAARVCPSCGKPIPPESKFCTSCGRPAPPLGSTQAPGQGVVGTTCATCGAQLKPAAKFCTSCGSPSPTPGSAPILTPSVGQPSCARCGAQLKPNSKFCTSCGGPVQQGPAAQPVVRPVLTPRAASVPPAPAATVCSGCGSPLKSDAKFCVGCGKPAPAPTAGIAWQPAAQAGFCTKCGASLPAEARFCTRCGQTRPG